MAQPMEKDELRILLKKAKSFADEHPPQYNRPMSPDKVTYLYRDAREEYFKEIRTTDPRHQIIQPKLKYRAIINPRCPIRGKLNGTFFGVTRMKKKLPNKSPYGNKRVTIPLSKVFTDDTNLYFADFHCSSKNKDMHYIILVLTPSGSEADEICNDKLIELDPGDNKFMWKEWGPTRGLFRTVRKGGLWILVIYTEEVSIKGRELSTVTHDTSRKMQFVTKNLDCGKCNLSEKERSEVAGAKQRGRKRSRSEDEQDLKIVKKMK